MTINKTQFEKSLESLKKVSLTAREKGTILSTLSRYAEKNPAVVTPIVYAWPTRFWRKLVAVVIS